MNDERRQCRFKLNLGLRTMEAAAAVPVRPVRPLDMVPIFLSLSGAVASAGEADAEALGTPVSCRVNCAACCRQAIPVSEIEARYLVSLVESMPEQRRQAVKDRFRQALEQLERAGLLEEARNTDSPTTTREARARFNFEYFRAWIDCPFLENEQCSIYEHRPAVCREYMVHSPAGNCARPTPETIDIVPLAVRPSAVLYSFQDGKGEAPMNPILLVIALEWAEAHKDDPQPEVPGPRMFESFLYRLRERMTSTE
jgi:Fe-S-cluster containining protein